MTTLEGFDHPSLIFETTLFGLALPGNTGDTVPPDKLISRATLPLRSEYDVAEYDVGSYVDYKTLR
jgi:hypothetical protein